MYYRVRQARKSDFDAIRGLDWECFPDDSDIDLNEAGTVWWVAEQPGRIVAYASARPWGRRSGSVLVMSRAGTTVRHRGNGLQRRLIRARLAYARRNGFRWVRTHTTHRNVVSSNNLIAAGFKLWMPSHWEGAIRPWKPEGDYAFLYWQRKVSK